MDERAEQARREAETWAEFEAALSRVPQDRLTTPGVLEGWSVKEMLHHVTGWLEVCAGHLEAMRVGTFEEPDDPQPVVDVKNAAFAELARGMEVEAVRAGLDDARELLLQRWRDLTEIDEVAVEWFAGETYEHYEEHLPDLRRAAGG